MESPFEVEVHDGAFARRGWIGDPVRLTVTPRHNARGSVVLTVDNDHRRLPELSAPGARLVIRYDGQVLLTGRVRLRTGRGPGISGQTTFTVEDDLRLLWRVLGWPVPTAGLSAQTSGYDTRTGPAETVVKAFVQANAVTRLGLPVTVAPDLARGGNITVSTRMHPLADRLFPMVDVAGIGVTVRQNGPGLLLDCYTPAASPRTLTEQSGVVQDWSYSLTDPQATRVIVGGQGEGTARSFTSSVDAAREAEWADVLEVFRDRKSVV